MLPGIDGQTAKVRTVSPMKWLKKDIPGRGLKIYRASETGNSRVHSECLEDNVLGRGWVHSGAWQDQRELICLAEGL